MNIELRTHLRMSHCWEQDFIDSSSDADLEQQHGVAHYNADHATPGTHLFDIAFPHSHGSGAL